MCVAGVLIQTRQPALQSVFHRLLGLESHPFLVPVAGFYPFTVVFEPSLRRFDPSLGFRPVVWVAVVPLVAVLRSFTTHCYSIGVRLSRNVMLGQPASVESLPSHANDIVGDYDSSLFPVRSYSGAGGQHCFLWLCIVGYNQQVYVRVVTVVPAGAGAKEHNYRRFCPFLGYPGNFES